MNIVAGKGHTCLFASGQQVPLSFCYVFITLSLACSNKSKLSLFPMTVFMKKNSPG